MKSFACFFFVLFPFDFFSDINLSKKPELSEHKISVELKGYL